MEISAKCPLCGCSVEFCSDHGCTGCHYLICRGCEATFDLSVTVDPENSAETLDELRARIIKFWNESLI